uniref:Secreted salivary acid phosphatase n=1 Tax=Xenopsylla cheopis TaxID=163159 RepID=UPI002D21EE96|nr:Chain A, Secreted salivary acid phosphatase [Xenopsylla cheopis]8GDL_B Chain B, Secreted salivary acid phosphatase [Xenopsylla cheopis]
SGTGSDDLKFVFVMARGGDFVAGDYAGGPKIINKEAKDSELTEQGKQEAFQLGTKLSGLYKTKLGVSKWDSKTYWPVAISQKRAQVSTLITGAGLEGDQSKRDKTWTDQELKATSFPAMESFSRFIKPSECPNYLKELLAQQGEITTIVKECISSVQQVKSKYPAVDEKMPQHIWLAYETLKKLKRQQPSSSTWMTDDLMKNLRECSAKITWLATTKTDTLRKLSGGLLLNDLFNDMDQITQGKAQPNAPGGKDSKLNVFTVSQFLVISQLAAFMPEGSKLNNKAVTASDIYPEDGSHVDIEMYQENNKWSVKLVYVSGKDKQPQTITLPGCQEKCPYEQFKSALQKYKITDEEHQKACKN